MIYLASFKGTKTGWQGLVERITRWATKSDYAHSEICIGNPFDGPVSCVSSTGVDGGVRGKTMQLSPPDWDIDPLPWVAESDVSSFLAAYVGEGYDVVGCFRTELPFVSHEHPTKWFCSEVVATICGFEEPWRSQPGSLRAAVLSINKISKLVNKNG